MDKKISELDELFVANNNDLLPIVDVLNLHTKKITCQNFRDTFLLSNIPYPVTSVNGLTGSVTIASESISSNSTIVCKVGDDLAIKYAAAKALTPGGNALSATNRATLIIMPGNYSVSSTLAIDTNYVDVIGLGSVKLERGAIPAVNLSGGINVTATNVRVKGISVGTDSFTISGEANQVFEDCTGGDYSFGGGGYASGSFVNCSGGFYSFGGYGTASGTFTNCSGGFYSFGGYGTASGTFTNCSGGFYSFGGDGGTASGTFTNCSGGTYSFGCYGTASGTFTDCSGGDGSFGSYGGIASGKFLKCTLTSGSFPTLSSDGKYRLCTDGNYNVINADYVAP